jgi:hypothetical protein
MFDKELMKTILYKGLLVLLFLLATVGVFSQAVINGNLKNRAGKPIANASVILKNAFEGATTDSLGNFKLATTTYGQDTLVISATGFEDYLKPILLEENKTYSLNYKLTEVVSELDEVVISAGTIEANNERAVAVLKPLDIVTTAGALGDIAGAIQTLPGVQRNGGDQTGLMVRGGDVSESAMIVDGCVAQNAFGSSVPGVAQRSRFNPFQFKGTAFSSGGYTARYGQALSSILDLQTTDLPDKNTLNIGANMAGASLSGSKLFGDNAVEFSGNYTNVTPFYAVTPTNNKFYDVPQGGSFSTRWISKFENNSWFKMNFSQSFTKMGLNIANPVVGGERINFGMQNENTFFNSSYKYWKNPHLRYFTAVSVSNNNDDIEWAGINMLRSDRRVQGRGEVWYEFGRHFNLLAGTEIQRISYMQRFDTLLGKFDELLSAVYLEGEYKPARWFAIKPGVRAEYSQLIARTNIAPRCAFAFKTGQSSQISFAGGVFYQNAAPQYLLQGYRPGFQQAVHYMANYQIMKNDRVFRIEAYYKSYAQLIRENGVMYTPNQNRFYFGTVDNSGNGYARGVDFFWRDKKSIKNFDYWISYSFIDTKRLYQNYISKVTPDYVSQNNLNVITKYFIQKWQTNISVSYNYASGRAYYNPLNPVFLGDKAPDYHNVAISIAYLATIKKVFAVFYLSIDNVTNQHNILGYRYSFDGSQRYPMLPPMYRSIFFGFNLSLTKFKQDELP